MSTNIKIFGGPFGSSLRTHWVAAELGTSYERAPLEMSKGEHKREPFLKINPMGQVPALLAGDFNLAESMAICSYLIDLAGSDLAGKTPEIRARAWQWSLWAAFNPQPHLNALASPAWTQKPLSAEAEETAKTAAAKVLPLLDAHLATQPYIAGNEFTVGDINVASSLAYAAMCQFDMSPYPNVTAWLAKVTARPGYAQARG
ncbi:MAG: Disulfide-bond oxidoreductase YfcG [Pseudomonadota bacterium]|jgi:glutathione S-transferase